MALFPEHHSLLLSPRFRRYIYQIGDFHRRYFLFHHQALDDCGRKVSEADLAADKMACEWLDGALALKYADQADDLRRTAQKDTGSVRFADGEITVKADLPKRVVWDQTQLARMVERIRAVGDDPAEIVDISYKVAERKFAAWPASMQEAFCDARTVHPGKLRITLLDEGAAQ